MGGVLNADLRSEAAMAPAADGRLLPCPWLPVVEEVHDFTVTRRHGDKKGHAFFMDALRFAQSQWQVGKPAQALLQLDKAWMADLADGEGAPDGCDPYRALVWIMKRAAAGDCGYMGNPVRHFQHLASRMSGPRAEIRSWRAWLCMHLAEKHLPQGEYPRDGVQLAREGLWVPGSACALSRVAELGWPGEAEVAAELLSGPGC